MSERPIEEVIGWTALPHGWKAPADGQGGYYWRESATVDDLAAWLDGHVADWAFDDRRLGGPWQVFWFPDDTSVTPDQADEEPTILAALTAAVRKVADACRSQGGRRVNHDSPFIATIATIAAVIVTLGTFAVVADAVNDDPCTGHQTPDGITADQMGPCDELPAVA